MASWLCILNRENFEVVTKDLVWGVALRHREQLAKAMPGDKCAFYLVREYSIGGILEIISNMYEDTSDIFPSKMTSGEKYPYRVRLKPINIFKKGVPFKPLVQTLIFITNKKHYGGYIMGKAMRRIPDSDMKLISKYEEVSGNRV
jgi:predicted RNA-binding protein